MTMTQAAETIFGSASTSSFGSESARLAALRRAVDALDRLHGLGLECGVFGSALRPGDFFYNSDVDLAAWLPGRAPLPHDLALRARIECHRAMQGLAFDLVLLPSSNAAFEQRIVYAWSRGPEETARASRDEPMHRPLVFGPADVAFIDKDRLAIAKRAAARMVVAAAAEPGTRSELALCASMQTVVRVSEKCAKDVLREFCDSRPAPGTNLPLYPLLAYPCEALGGIALASEASLALYYDCQEMLEPPPPGGCPSWRSRAATLATLFAASMHADFVPAMSAMELMPPRARSEPHVISGPDSMFEALLAN